MQKKGKTSFFSGLTGNTYLLALNSFFADVATEMLYPILPIFLTQTLQASGSIVGIIEGVGGTTQYLIQGVSGWLADKWQQPKKIAFIGYLLAAISKPLIGLATSWPFVLIFRFTDRLGTGTRSAPRDALIAASADEEHRGKAFGLEGFGDNLGAFVGPLLAIVLIFSLHVDIHTIFYLSLIPGLLAVLMILLIKQKQSHMPAKTKINFNFRSFPPAFKRYLIAAGVFGLGNSSNAFLILQARSLGVSFKGTIFIYAAFNLTAALISYPAGHLSDKIGRKTILFIAFFIFFITYAGFAAVRQLWVIATLFCLYGLFQGIYRSVGKSIAADFSPANLKASGLGWYATVIGITGLFASVIAGILWDKAGHATVFLFGAFFAVAGMIALALLLPNSNHTPSHK